MKKSILSIAVAVLLLGVASMSFAATKNFQLSVIIATAEIDFSAPAPYADFGTVQLGEQKVGTENAGLRNIGYGTIRYILSGSDTDANWDQITNPTAVLGNDEYRIWGIFSEDVRSVQVSDFSGVADLITSTSATCSTSIHAFDTEDNGFKGYNVSSGAWRNLLRGYYGIFNNNR